MKNEKLKIVHIDSIKKTKNNKNTMYISEKGKCNQWQKFIGLHFRTMSEGEEIQAMEIQEDVILKEYNFKKWNGKILTRVTYDLKKKQQELFNKRQLKLW